MHEIWKPVLGFEGLYEVSNLGQVKSLERLVENNGGLETSRQNIKKAQQANIGSHHSNETKEKIRARLTGIHKGKRWKTVDGKRVWIERGL